MIRSLALTIVVSVLLLAWTLQAGQGLAFFLAIPFYIVLFPWALYTSYKYPDRRKVAYAKMSIWLLTFVLFTAVHGYRANANARAARELANRIDDYKQSHGFYPATLEAVGEGSLAREHGMRYSLFSRGDPFLWYPSTLSVFDIYSYDFQKHQWVFHPD